MINEELRKQLEDLETEFAEPEPVVESQVDLLARLEELEDEPEPIPEPEADETKANPVMSSGSVSIRFKHSMVRRNYAGQIIESIGERSHTIFQRDVTGRVVGIDQIEEFEDVTEDVTEGEDEGSVEVESEEVEEVTVPEE